MGDKEFCGAIRNDIESLSQRFWGTAADSEVRCGLSERQCQQSCLSLCGGSEELWMKFVQFMNGPAWNAVPLVIVSLVSLFRHKTWKKSLRLRLGNLFKSPGCFAQGVNLHSPVDLLFLSAFFFHNLIAVWAWAGVSKYREFSSYRLVTSCDIESSRLREIFAHVPTSPALLEALLAKHLR